MKTQVADREKRLETLKASAGDNETLKQQIADLQAENTKVKETHESEMNQLKVDFAVEKALTGAKAKNIKAVKALLDLYTWNGKLVVIDDDLPTVSQEGFYIKVKSTDEGALEVVANTAAATAKQVKMEDVIPVADSYTAPAVGDYVVFVDAFTEYMTYIMGNGAFSFEDTGAKLKNI